MRRAQTSLGVALVLTFGGVARAQPTARPAELIDLRAERANYAVLTDPDGIVYVMRVKTEGASGREWFVGDGKVFYRQRVSSSSADSTTGHLSWAAWSPRTSQGLASIDRNPDGSVMLWCGDDSARTPITVALQPVPTADAERILTTAQFRPEFWARRAHILARDAQGTYYYIDRLREVAGSQTRRGHRVFVGKRGAMKQVPLTTVVDDSAGEIYATKRGELRLTADRDGQARWTRGKKTVELVSLPVRDNPYLIYRELGIYGHLGVACEDL